MQAKGLETALRYEKEAVERIRRMSIAAAELEVRPGKKSKSGGGLEEWIEGGAQSGEWE